MWWVRFKNVEVEVVPVFYDELVPQRDEAALQRAIERVLSDRELKKELSRNIRKKAEDFSIDKAVSQTLALYRFLTKK